MFNPDEQAENLRKYGGFIPGIRPGKYRKIYRVCFGKINHNWNYIFNICSIITGILLSRTSIPFYLGGTALLIVVVVMIDFITQVQSHLFQHQYGITKKN